MIKIVTWVGFTTLATLVGATLAPAVGHAGCDDEAREQQEQIEEAQISRSNDATILNMYSKHNSDTSAVMRHGLAPTGDPGSREGDRRKAENDTALRERLQQNQQTFDRQQSNVEAQYRQGASSLVAPCEQGSNLKGQFPRSVPGLYSTLLPLGNKQSNYIYLSADGTFFHRFPDEGLDGFDINLMQKHQLWRSFTGRYSIRDGKVVLRYGPGGYEGEVEITIHEQGYFPNRTGKDYVQLPVVDGMSLASTYQLVKEQLPLFFTTTNELPIEAFVTFMPDGKFIDGGVLDRGNQSYIRSTTNRQWQKSSGTYRLKNHTLHLRYDDGRMIRSNFHVRSNSRGEPNLDKLYIAGFRFFRVEPLPLDRLPQLEFPQGWKSQRDPTLKGTFYFPLNVSQSDGVAVLIADPQSLPNPEQSSRFPGRLHDGGVQGAIKGYMSSGWRTERMMTRDPLGQIPSSTGAFILPDGKRVWVTIFTLISRTEFRTISLMSQGEELHTSQFATMKAILNDGGAAPSTRTIVTDSHHPASGFTPRKQSSVSGPFTIPQDVADLIRRYQ